ncbi:MAG: hypothetical protein HZY79_15290 [Rhodoblastus sp.]|nr:MAG: hypothetical protein HZY79_15290 [Rhodoblastus sp.]
MTLRLPTHALSRTLAFAGTLAQRTPLRLRPFLVGFAVAATLQACAAVSVVGTAASVAATAATTAVGAGVTAAGVGVSAAGSAVKAVTP